MTGQLKRGKVAFKSIFVPNYRVGPNKHVVTNTTAVLQSEGVKSVIQLLFVINL